MTVGRIVHYHEDADNVSPAIVVKVWSETLVNLQVFTDDGAGSTTHRTSVAEGSEPGCWSWPVKPGD